MSADFFSAMYELRESTAQQSPSEGSPLPKKERYIVKCSPWLSKSKPKPALTHEIIKKQIGNCTICFSLPNSDCIQLNICLCIFCRNCFEKYLDNFATPTPVLKKAFISKDPVDWNKKKFAGFFDAKLLAPDGTAVPSQVKPPKPRQLTNVCDFESRRNSLRRRRRKIPDDSTWYKIVKKEQFNCPNCNMYYEMNRTELKRNRTVSDILERMIENERVYL